MPKPCSFWSTLYGRPVDLTYGKPKLVPVIDPTDHKTKVSNVDEICVNLVKPVGWKSKKLHPIDEKSWKKIQNSYPDVHTIWLTPFWPDFFTWPFGGDPSQTTYLDVLSKVLDASPAEYVTGKLVVTTHPGPVYESLPLIVQDRVVNAISRRNDKMWTDPRMDRSVSLDCRFLALIEAGRPDQAGKLTEELYDHCEYVGVYAGYYTKIHCRYKTYHREIFGNYLTKWKKKSIVLFGGHPGDLDQVGRITTRRHIGSYIEYRRRQPHTKLKKTPKRTADAVNRRWLELQAENEIIT